MTQSAPAFRHVVLVGLSGSGKSTAGRLLAKRLRRPFWDTDELIEAQTGMLVTQIFAGQGEAAFRELERRAVVCAVQREPAVIATGGGAPVDADNHAALWGGNLVVWLEAKVESLLSRVGPAGAGRPLLAGNSVAERLRALRAGREPVYATAHARVDTTALSAEEVVDKIMQLLHAPTATTATTSELHLHHGMDDPP